METKQHDNPSVDPRHDPIVDRARVVLREALGGGNGGNSAAAKEGEGTAAILAPLGFDSQLLAAAIVYPLVRDEIIRLQDLDADLAAQLAEPVGQLLNFGRFRLPQGWQPGEALATSQAEVLRKMLLALVSDPRLVVIRLAEQLYRMRASDAAAADIRHALAVETREIFAPLANRLGIWQLKWELEDLAFRTLDRDAYMHIARYLKEKRRERVAAVELVRQSFADELVTNGINAEVTGRPKHIYSIWKKMQRKQCGVEQIFDIEALRIFVGSIQDCYAALGIVHQAWPWLSGEFDDYIANPKQNNYRSLHTAVVGPGGRVVEAQIRTHEMDREAELGVAAHWRYKEGSQTAEPGIERKIRLLRQLVDTDDEAGDPLDEIRSGILEDRVYAFTPKGDVVEMPAGATPLDFAYHVHTGVGHRCRGARVNGRIVPLTHTLQSGDRVEVITAKVEHPSRDWLSPHNGYLHSARSRARVRSWFRHLDKDDNEREGREILDRELARLNMKGTASAAIAECLKFASVEVLYESLGSGDMTSSALARGLQQLRGSAKPPAASPPRRAAQAPSLENSPAISGVDNVLCHLAHCCHPVAPEPIIGYITQGRGVSIHRRQCGNVRHLESRYPERIIEVGWGGGESLYPVELIVQAFDREGLMRDIVGVLADRKVGVTASRFWTDRENMQATFELEVAVPGLSVLSQVIGRLEQVPNVTSVQRKVGA